MVDMPLKPNQQKDKMEQQNATKPLMLIDVGKIPNCL